MRALIITCMLILTISTTQAQAPGGLNNSEISEPTKQELTEPTKELTNEDREQIVWEGVQCTPRNNNGFNTL